MILLERGNRILGETVSCQFNRDPEEKVETYDVKLCDFDDVAYRVLMEPEDKNILSISMAMPCYSSIAEMGCKASFEKAYGSMVSWPAADKYDVTIKVKLDELKDQKTKDDLVTRIATLKASTLSGVFDHFFSSVLTGATLPNFTFNLRSDTAIYLFPKAGDRCTVIFGVDFKEKVDRAIAKVFMQEFCDARRQGGLGAAPGVTFGINPPAEMAHFKITEPTGNLGFVTFAVLKSHLEKDKKERVTAVMSTFRNYLQYHIKCSKAHFHSRMRARVASLLQILNRAKAEPPGNAEKNAKTMRGTTFVRKV